MEHAFNKSALVVDGLAYGPKIHSSRRGIIASLDYGRHADF